MPEIITPDFGRFPIEGQIIGRLLAGYGELELELCKCVGEAIDDIDLAIKELFFKQGKKKRIKRNESERIEFAREKATLLYANANLDATFESTLNDMHHCRLIRNQYAHCHWYATTKDGLGFIDLEEVAENSGPLLPLAAHRRLIDLGFLEQQEAFFVFVKKCFWYLEAEYGTRVNSRPAHIWRLPAPVPRPPKRK